MKRLVHVNEILDFEQEIVQIYRTMKFDDHGNAGKSMALDMWCKQKDYVINDEIDFDVIVGEINWDES